MKVYIIYTLLYVFNFVTEEVNYMFIKGEF